MTGPEFKETLQRLGWSARHLAGILGKNDRTVRRWIDDLYPVPDIVVERLAMIEAAIAQIFTAQRDHQGSTVTSVTPSLPGKNIFS